MSRIFKVPDSFIEECRIIHDKQSQDHLGWNHPFQKLPEARASSGGHSPRLRFIFWTHKFENIDSLQPLLEDRDILAVEDCRDTVFDTQEKMDQEVRALEKIYKEATTILASTKFDNNKKIQLLQNTGLPEIYKAVLASSTNSITQIAKLDIGPYEARDLSKLDQALLECERIFGKAFDSLLCSWMRLRGLAHADSSALAEVNLYREAVMTRQIERLRVENPNKTIAVLVGRSHHTISLRFNRDGIYKDRYILRDETVDELPARIKHWAMNKLVSADRLSVGLDPTLELDQMILNEIINYCGEEDMFLSLTSLDNEKNQKLIAKLQAIWDTPISKNQSDFASRVHERKQATSKVLRMMLDKIH